MKIVHEDLWTPAENTIYIVTTNATIRKDGALVMGRGAALEATKRYPGIAYECGKIICNSGSTYGVLRIRPDFYIFQVKRHWAEPADLELIKGSALRLQFIATSIPNKNFRMNYPGIGNGRLKREDVQPLLKTLPDNVIICLRQVGRDARYDLRN
jgi:hypothetical protein